MEIYWNIKYSQILSNRKRKYKKKSMNPFGIKINNQLISYKGEQNGT